MKLLTREKKKPKFPFSISLEKKKKGRFCCAYACYNDPISKKGGLCHNHYRIKRKFLDPVADRYFAWKGKAKQRGIDHGVSLTEFRNWCNKTGYIITKGVRGMNATIDRRCNFQGYYLFNMRLIKHRENSSKGNSHNGDNFDCPF